MTLAIDVSNYTGAIDTVKARALYVAGVRRAIVQVVNPSILTHRNQIPALLDAGIEVQGYVYIWFSAGEQFVAGRVNWVCSELDRYAMTKMLWLDCEQGDNDDPPFDYVHAPVTPTIRAAVAAARTGGYEPGIYTAAWWWIPGASNSQEWAALPLWNANYDLDPDLDPVNYGGWTVPRMEQYQGSTPLAGVPMVDLNSYEGPPPVPPPDPRIVQARDLLNQVLGA